jgi:hypothetical protein
MEEQDQREYFADVPYPMFDALLAEAIVSMVTLRYTRKDVTSGSCSYTVFLERSKGERQVFGQIDLRTTVQGHTYISLTPAPGEAGVLRVIVRNAWSFVAQALERDQNYPTPSSISELAGILPDVVPGTARRQRGAEEDPINRDAREAILRGDDRKAVFRKWARAKKYNLSDTDESRKADDAFRRMLSRKPKSSRRDVT